MADYNKLKNVLISSLVWGLFAHGISFFNTFSFHDDIRFHFSVGNTFDLGRWGLHYFQKITNLINGSGSYSLPLFNRILTILFISIIIYVIVDFLKIEKKIYIFILSGLMVTFPTVTGLLGFPFTSPYYYFGLLLGIIGIYRVLSITIYSPSHDSSTTKEFFVQKLKL